MFKKSERLSRSEFTYFFGVGKRLHFPYFTLIQYPYAGRKVAVVVGKKVAKSAVQRNRFKRRINATLYKELTKEHHSGILIVLVKPPYRTITRKQADAEVRKAIAQVIKSA